MRPLVRPAVLAALLGGLLAAVPAGAEARTAPVAGTVTTVRTTCVDGEGTFRLRQRILDSGSTRVGLSAQDVRDGRWRGEYDHPILGTADETDRPLRVTATDHAFTTSFDVDGDTSSAGVLMRTQGGHPCVAAFADRAKRTVVSNSKLVVVVRYPRPGHLTERMIVVDCVEGSRWRVTSRYHYDDGSALGSGSGGFVCHDGVARVPRSELGTNADAGRPHGFGAVARSSTGEVRRVAFGTRSASA